MARVPLNTSDIEQSLLNIERKERSNPLPWNGQFSPQLVEVLLKKYAGPGTLVIDPFGGSGTLLYEAAKQGLPAVAADINPAACYLARIHTLSNLSGPQRSRIIEMVDNALDDYLKPPLFNPGAAGPASDKSLSRLLGIRQELADVDAKLLLETLIVLSDFVYRGCDSRVLLAAWKRLRALMDTLPYSQSTLKVLNCDARRLEIEANSVGLVITSPPYINVFNYHQHYRLSVEALGWDLLQIAKSEIGSNRKNRGNRFLTVIQYCLDMTQVFLELKRICREHARLVFVVGRESRVLGLPFFNGRIIGILGTKCAGYDLLTRQERVFTNRFGQSIYEDILHFASSKAAPSRPLDEARAVARWALREAAIGARSEVRATVEAAASEILHVAPSPLYVTQEP